MVTRGSDSFSYDQANRLKSATVWSVDTFVYDGYGKRTSATFGTNPVANYVYDASQGLSMLLVDGTRKYVWGANGLSYDTHLGGDVQAVARSSIRKGFELRIITVRATTRPLTFRYKARARTCGSDRTGNRWEESPNSPHDSATSSRQTSEPFEMP